MRLPIHLPMGWTKALNQSMWAMNNLIRINVFSPCRLDKAEPKQLSNQVSGWCCMMNHSLTDFRWDTDFTMTCCWYINRYLILLILFFVLRVEENAQERWPTMLLFHKGDEGHRVCYVRKCTGTSVWIHSSTQLWSVVKAQKYTHRKQY